MASERRKRRGMLAVGATASTPDARRRLLADWCKLLGARLTGLPQASNSSPADSPADSSADSSAESSVASKPVRQGVMSPAEPPVSQSAKVDPLAGVHLSRREHQILAGLLGGDSEKQIARKLTISPHTVHTYVKKLHKTLDVSSRGELMARFVNR